MCACSFRSGSAPVLVKQGYSTVIASNSFSSGRTYETFMFYRCINEGKFLQALSTVRIDKNGTTLNKVIKKDTDVQQLAKWADTGNDRKVWGVDIKSVLGNIQFTNDEVNNASCKIVAFSN